MPKNEQIGLRTEASKESGEKTEGAEALGQRLIGEASSEVLAVEGESVKMAEELKKEFGISGDADFESNVGEFNKEALAAAADFKAAVEREKITEEIYELRGAKGEFIARAIAGYGQEAFVESIGRRARILKSLMLVGEKDGKPTEVDILRLTGAVNESGVEVAKIYILNEKLRKMAAFDFDDKVVISPEPVSSIDVAMLLHELGHAEQDREGPYRSSGEIYQASRFINNQQSADYKSIKELFDLARVKFPGIDHQMNSEVERKIIDMDNEAADAYIRNRDLRERLEEIQAKRNIDEGEERFIELEKEKVRASLNLKEKEEKLGRYLRESGVYDAVCIPVRTMERDATLRAFLWMREIRKNFGIDLFKEARVKQDASELGGERKNLCTDSVVDGLKMNADESVMDARTNLKKAYGSYGATPRNIRKGKRGGE